MMHPPTRPRPYVRRLLLALGCALFALLGHVPAGAAPPAFIEPTVIPTLGGTVNLSFNGVAKGDFNGDGHLDLAAAYTNNDGNGHIEIALGNGDGTFQTPTSITIPANTNGGEVDGDAVLAKDFNGDGHLDLAVTTTNSTVLIFLGHGDGTFAPPISVALPAGANGLQAGDVNGDGKLDLVALLNSTHQVAVLTGHGDGTFVAPVTYSVDANPQDMALADVDGKNGPDILVATYGGPSVDCLLNNGNGTFAPEKATGTGGKSLQSLYVADFDGDGKPDVVAGGTGQVADAAGYHFASFVFLKGNGDGTFQPASASNDFPVAGNFPLRVLSENVTPDLNGDGHPDVVFSIAAENLLTVGYGDGKGGFAVSNVAASGGSGLPNTVIGGAEPVSFVFGSFTGQPLPDILVASQNTNAGPGGLSLVRANPAKPGAFLSAYAYSTGDRFYNKGIVSDIASFALGDFLHNGRVSLAVLGSSPPQNGVVVLPGLGDGTFASLLPDFGNVPSLFSAIDPGDAGFVNGLVSSDFNGDGFPDLIFNATGGIQASNQPYQLWSFGNGSGAFGNTGGVKTAVGIASTPSEVADFNRDGHPDFAAYVNEGGGGPGVPSNVHVLVYAYGPGANTFTPTADLFPGPTFDQHGYAAGDFDGDGKADLIVHTYTPERLWFYKGNGDGTFQAPVASSPGLANLFASATADLNGDGKLDLIFGTYGGIIVMLGNGDGTFQQPVTYAVPGNEDISGLAVADFNADGHPDVAVAGARDAVILPGNGDGTLGAPLSFATGFQNNTAAVHAADLNGDGRPDLVYSSPGNANNVDFSVLLAAVPSAHTHLLWNNADGKAAFWDVDGQGNLMGLVTYGPFTDGGQNVWHATSMATGPDGVSHIVWNNPDGKVALWTVQTNGSVTGTTGFGPYADGSSLWHVAGVSVGPDNLIHLLWTNPDHKAAFWNVTPGGSPSVLAGYGPFFDGSSPWDAVGVSTGPDNVSHLLWRNADGHDAFWNVSNTNGAAAALAGYGPYTDGGNLWGALGLSVGPDDVSHLLWSNPDGKAAFWSVSGANGSIGGVTGYGPYTDGAASNLWGVTALATGPDNVSHLLWNNTDGKAALWALGATGSIGSVTVYGPYTDGSAQNVWSATAVSVGP